MRLVEHIQSLAWEDLLAPVDWRGGGSGRVEAGGLDIVGHFDKIGLNASYVQPGIEDEPWYSTHIARVVDAIAASGLTAEINTKARTRHGRFFPASRWWPLLKDAGVPVVVNSDAHDPALTDASRREAFNLLDTLI